MVHWRCITWGLDPIEFLMSIRPHVFSLIEWHVHPVVRTITFGHIHHQRRLNLPHCQGRLHECLQQKCQNPLQLSRSLFAKAAILLSVSHFLHYIIVHFCLSPGVDNLSVSSSPNNADIWRASFVFVRWHESKKRKFTWHCDRCTIRHFIVTSSVVIVCIMLLLFQIQNSARALGRHHKIYTN